MMARKGHLGVSVQPIELGIGKVGLERAQALLNPRGLSLPLRVNLWTTIHTLERAPRHSTSSLGMIYEPTPSIQVAAVPESGRPG